LELVSRCSRAGDIRHVMKPLSFGLSVWPRWLWKRTILKALDGSWWNIVYIYSGSSL